LHLATRFGRSRVVSRMIGGSLNENDKSIGIAPRPVVSGNRDAYASRRKLCKTAQTRTVRYQFIT
jgi:hypothetical protein